jgi:hypothetical protein
MSDLNMPGHADGVQGDDPVRDEDLEYQSQFGEDPGDLTGEIARTPIPPD